MARPPHVPSQPRIVTRLLRAGYKPPLAESLQRKALRKMLRKANLIKCAETIEEVM
jgi:hypothetical protein